MAGAVPAAGALPLLPPLLPAPGLDPPAQEGRGRLLPGQRWDLPLQGGPCQRWVLAALGEGGGLVGASLGCRKKKAEPFPKKEGRKGKDNKCEAGRGAGLDPCARFCTPTPQSLPPPAQLYGSCSMGSTSPLSIQRLRGQKPTLFQNKQLSHKPSSSSAARGASQVLVLGRKGERITWNNSTWKRWFYSSSFSSLLPFQRKIAYLPISEHTSHTSMSAYIHLKAINVKNHRGRPHEPM